MQRPDIRLPSQLRFVLLFLLFYACVRFLPIVFLGYPPFRPLDYVVGLGYSLWLVLGYRAILPSFLVGVAVYVYTMDTVVGLSMSVVYLCAYRVAMGLTYTMAGSDPWLSTSRSVRAFLTGSFVVSVLTTTGTLLFVDSSASSMSGSVLWRRVLSDISREWSGILAVGPVVLVVAAARLRRICGLPPDPRADTSADSIQWGEALGVSAVSIAVLILAVIYRNNVGFDVVVLGFAPLVILAARSGLSTASVALSTATLTSGFLWSFFGSNDLIHLADLRLIVVAASVTTIVTAQHVEGRRAARSQVQRRILELRALTARTEAAREAERTRLAREVHDELGQLLTGLKINLKMTATGLRPKPEQELAAAAGEIDAILAQTERIGNELAPELMETPESMLTTLQRIAAESQARFGISVTVEGQDVALSPGPRFAVCRIVQEALTNVARHAEASHAWVRLHSSNGRVHLSVEDNGRGFATSGAERAGLGVLGMKERAAILGGTLRLSSGVRGTVVTLEIPRSL